jgi:hypothetical protein
MFWVEFTVSNKKAVEAGDSTTGFLLGLLFIPEDEGEMFLRNVLMSPNYATLQPTYSL